jgi:protein-L-isoaspartate(D-aspartate) O-methyltransferase
MPVGPEEMQRLTVVEKDADGQTRVQELLPVRFGRLETIT